MIEGVFRLLEEKALIDLIFLRVPNIQDKNSTSSFIGIDFNFKWCGLFARIKGANIFLNSMTPILDCNIQHILSELLTSVDCELENIILDDTAVFNFNTEAASVFSISQWVRDNLVTNMDFKSIFGHAWSVSELCSAIVRLSDFLHLNIILRENSSIKINSLVFISILGVDLEIKLVWHVSDNDFIELRNVYLYILLLHDMYHLDASHCRRTRVALVN